MAGVVSSTSSVILVILLLGLLHAVVLVQSFTSSSSLPTSKKKTIVAATPIIRPPSSSSSSSSSNSLLSTASSWYQRPSTSSSSSSALRVSSLEKETEIEVDGELESTDGLPELGADGLWHITTEDEYKALLDANPDKLIILKVFAPWCKACKGLAPKFQAIKRDEKYQNLPLVWASLNIQGNKAFVKSIGVLALPTVQLYAGNGVKVDTFPCGPSKVPILKRKLMALVNENVDAKTRLLKSAAVVSEVDTAVADGSGVNATTTAVTKPKVRTMNETLNTVGINTDAGQERVTLTKKVITTPSVNATLAYPSATTPKEGEETVKEVIEREKSMLRSVKYMTDLLESNFDTLLSKANLLTFEAGSVVMREGNMGRTFYIILEGEVEICQRTSFEDPLTTPSEYLGTVINQFEQKGDYFGERSLITGEPRAASIRASDKTVCLAFDKGDFPNTSILSGFSDTTLIDDAAKQRELEEINDKYNVAEFDIGKFTNDKIYNSTIGVSQQRGSVNTPNEIAGVDNDKEEAAAETTKESTETEEDKSLHVVKDPSTLGVGAETIVPLLMRLKLIRSITNCFKYTQTFKIPFGDPGSRRRRNILLNTLSPMQRTYIEDAFKLIDEDESELINLNEIKRVVNSVGNVNDIGLGSDDKIMDIIAEDSTSSNYAPWQNDNNKVVRGGDGVGGADAAAVAAADASHHAYNKKITKEDFFGLMAESETYQLFIDTFKTLDPHDSGFVRTKDLDTILCGVRDLISDDRKSIIDVVDEDMMVDYEQFSRMLLGTKL